MWHCPHCGAPQAETARCWVCRRSSTTCSTCRNFRLSLAADVGWCALDRRRHRLTGRELRGCWQGRPSAAEAPPSRTLAVVRWDGTPARGFVPIDDLPSPAVPEPSLPQIVQVEIRDAPTSLFGDAER